MDAISIDRLPNILEDFYTEVCKKRHKGQTIEYKNSTMKCLRTALNRFFKANRCVDIIADPHFIQADEMFKGITCQGKKEGRGEIPSMPTIEPEDFQKLSQYFKDKMAGPPDAVVLQQIVLFNLIYYMARQGRKNL